MEEDRPGTGVGLAENRKWNWLDHTLRKSGDSIAKQALQWTAQGHTGRGRPKNTWRRELENEMWTAGFRYSWRKTEEAAQDRAGWRRVTRHKSSDSESIT